MGFILVISSQHKTILYYLLGSPLRIALTVSIVRVRNNTALRPLYFLSFSLHSLMNYYFVEGKSWHIRLTSTLSHVGSKKD